MSVKVIIGVDTTPLKAGLAGATRAIKTFMDNLKIKHTIMDIFPEEFYQQFDNVAKFFKDSETMAKGF